MSPLDSTDNRTVKSPSLTALKAWSSSCSCSSVGCPFDLVATRFLTGARFAAVPVRPRRLSSVRSLGCSGLSSSDATVDSLALGAAWDSSATYRTLSGMQARDAPAASRAQGRRLVKRIERLTDRVDPNMWAQAGNRSIYRCLPLDR